MSSKIKNKKIRKTIDKRKEMRVKLEKLLIKEKEIKEELE